MSNANSTQPVVLGMTRLSGIRTARRPRRTINLAIVAWLAMFCSIFIFRESYLETVGLGNRENYYRIILVIFSAFAAASVLIANANRLSQAIFGPLMFLQLYGLYAMVTGFFLPEHALYTMWKGFEIAVDVLIILALLSYREYEVNALLAYRVIVAAFLILIGVWWIEALLWPEKAFIPNKGLLGLEMQGISPIYNPNTVGFAAAVVAYAMSCKVFSNISKFGKYLASIAFILAIATLIASQSRTGLAGFLLAILSYLFFRKLYKTLFFVIITASLLLLGTSFGEVTEQYLMRGQTIGSLSTLSGRTIAWQDAWDAFLRSPYFGNGFVAYTRAEIFGIGGSSHIHNALLEALVGTGIVGAFFWLGAVLWTGLQALRHRHASLSLTEDGHSICPGAEVIGILTLVIARAATSSGPALHDHSFMVLLAAVVLVAAMTKRGATVVPQ